LRTRPVPCLRLAARTGGSGQSKLFTKQAGGHPPVRSDITLGVRAATDFAGRRDLPDVVAFADYAAVTAGVLTQLDATLVEATRLHGVGLADAAMLTGVSYEAAKKRRRRAELAWLCWWAPELRPSLDSTPATAGRRAA
jgi:hypothetical protein